MSIAPKGEFVFAGAIERLSQRVEFMRFCQACDCDQQFISDFSCDVGLVGCCLGCGSEYIVPFTRATSEVA